jgi:tetratricopeptide (TPR) repeat protein
LQANGQKLVKYQAGTIVACQIPNSNIYSRISDFEIDKEGNLFIIDSTVKNLLVLSSEFDIRYQFDSYKSLLQKPTRLALHDDHIWLIDEGRQELLQFDLRWAITGLEHTLLGEEYLSVNLPKPALEELDKAIRLGFRDAQTYLLKGRAQYQLKLYAEALNSFSQAKEAGADTNFWQANTHFQLGQYEEALTIFKDLLATNRIDKNIVRFNIAETLMALKRFAEAEAIFRQLIQEEPNNSLARLGLGRALMALRRYSDLVTQLNMLSSDKTVGREARHYLGLAYMETGRFETALPLLERAAQEGPYFKEALQALVTLHRRLGLIERAEHYENQLKILKQQIDQSSTLHLLENER